MQTKYSVCNGCGKVRHIVNHSKMLCNNCNEERKWVTPIISKIKN